MSTVYVCPKCGSKIEVFLPVIEVVHSPCPRRGVGQKVPVMVPE